MKPQLPPELERCRVTHPAWCASTAEDGWNGFFIIKHRGKRYILIISDGGVWEHVSVEIEGMKRVPSWEDMCWIKDLCWRDDECVVQYHPPKSDYVNVHPYVLHLWRSIDQAFPQPPIIYV